MSTTPLDRNAISAQIRSKLTNCGWTDHVFELALRELMASPEPPSANSQGLAAIKQRSLEMLPQELKNEIYQEVSESLNAE